MDQNVKSTTSNRGAFLWVMLANSMLVSFARLMTLLFPKFFASVYTGGPSWGYVFNISIFIAEVVGITGILMWRKWGVYFLITITLVGIAEDFMYLRSQPSIADILLTTAVLSLFTWAVSRKWPHFR